jgi:hypothetical protein
MKHKQKQIVIYIAQAWAMPLFMCFIGIGKLAQGVEWICQNGIDIMNYVIFIPSMKWLDKHIKDTK